MLCVTGVLLKEYVMSEEGGPEANIEPIAIGGARWDVGEERMRERYGLW